MSERGPFAEIIKRVQAFKSNVDQIIIEEAKAFEAELIDLNTEGQLAEGYGSDERAIKPFYTPFTKLLKGLKGQESEFVTLKDTGDFYGSFKVDFGNNQLTFGATDSKTSELVDKYGAHIFGLDKANLQLFIDDYLRERVVARFRKDILN